MSKRCQKHCLHTATPHCRICCHCGRGVNTCETLDPMAVGRWVPRSEHGPHCLAAMCDTLTRTGSTEMMVRAHPYSITYPVTSATH
jgi:hypothetical protein